jgi:hypothetical protein
MICTTSCTTPALLVHHWGVSDPPYTPAPVQQVVHLVVQVLLHLRLLEGKPGIPGDSGVSR